MMRVMVLQPHDTAAGVTMPAMHDAIDTSLILWYVVVVDNTNLGFKDGV